MEKDRTYFPLFVNLDGVSVLVVGGGTVAERRIRSLLDFGAGITVLSPTLTAGLEQLMRDGRIIWKKGLYGKDSGTDAACFPDSVQLVLSASDDPGVNEAVFLDCRRRGIPVNCADKKEHCDFYFPALVRSEDLVIGISSGGTDHGRVRRAAERLRGFLAREKL